MVGNERAAVKPLPAADGFTHPVAKTVTVNPNGEAPNTRAGSRPGASPGKRAEGKGSKLHLIAHKGPSLLKKAERRD